MCVQARDRVEVIVECFMTSQVSDNGCIHGLFPFLVFLERKGNNSFGKKEGEIVAEVLRGHRVDVNWLLT